MTVMRFRVTATVDSDAIAENDFTVEFDKYRVGVTLNTDRSLKEIYIETAVDKDEKLPAIEPGTGLAKFNFVYSRPKCADDLIERLIYLESVGAFWWHIKSLNTHQVSEQWIPENEKEKKKLSLIGFSTTQSYKRHLIPIHDHQIKDLLDMEKYEKAMVIPMAFYREGTINFHSLKYINAFQNYFLMIEGLHGGGRSGSSALIKALVSSPELIKAATTMLGKVAEDPKDQHYKVLAIEIHDLGFDFDPIGLIKWLVRTRGQLSHFSLKSSKKQGHPLVQSDYRTHAYIAQGVCLFLYTNFHAGVIKKGGYDKK